MKTIAIKILSIPSCFSWRITKSKQIFLLRRIIAQKYKIFVPSKKQNTMETPINGFELMELGFPQGEIIGIALKINRKRNGFNRDQMLSHFKNVLETPENYREDTIFSSLALALIEKANECAVKSPDFVPIPIGKQHWQKTQWLVNTINISKRLSQFCNPCPQTEQAKQLNGNYCKIQNINLPQKRPNSGRFFHSYKNKFHYAESLRTPF